MYKPFDHRKYYGDDPDGHWTPYLEKWGIFGKLWLHKFYRGDGDPDPHDHPWPFWTFPLTTYVEEVTTPEHNPTAGFTDTQWTVRSNVVRAWRLHHRPASYMHRVIGPLKGWRYQDGTGLVPLVGDAPIWTIVWYGKKARTWGFLKLRDGRWCWQDWRAYLEQGGKSAPCADDEKA